MVKHAARILTVWAVLACFLFPGAAAAQDAGRQVLVLTADGPLTPAMYEYLNRGLNIARNGGVEVVIFQLNTPGGSIDLMNKMETSIRASQVPVVVYVAPRGAMAGSAGTVITLSGHAAAMAPETAIGAASPVGPQGQDIDVTEAAKTKEIMKATVRSLAERRGAEAIAIAQDTIETARAVSSTEAHQAGLVDFIATDTADLLRQLDGYKVITADGEHVLHTAGLPISPLNVSFIEQLLQILTNPNIVFLLLTLGVQAILIEISSPGGWIAGFVGVVALALATYGLGILPVNWFGIVFLVTAFILFLLDVKAPTHGALTVAGVVSFVVGALVLFNSPNVPSFQRVSVPLVFGTGLVTAAMFFVLVSFALRVRHAPVRTGGPPLIGRIGITRSPLSPDGTVQVGGELWSARLVNGETQLPRGTSVEVLGMDGIRLRVRRAAGDLNGHPVDPVLP